MSEERKPSLDSVSSSRPRSNTYTCYYQTSSASAIKCADIFAQFNALRIEGELCDLDVSIKSTSFNSSAHRLILATKSPFFKRYFADNKSATEFEFEEGFSADGVESILEYMYGSELVLSAENVEDLTKIAVFLELSEVVNRCCHFIINNLCINNYDHYISLAKELDLTWLTDKIFLFLEWNFVKLVESEEFLRLKAPQLYRILSSKRLRVGREETLYNAVMKWYAFDTENRQQSLESLFEKIHFMRMSPKFLAERVSPELVEDLGICEDKVSSAQSLHQTTSPSHTDIWQQGRSRDTSDAIYIFSSNEEFAERFDHVISTCVPCPEMKRGASVSGTGNLRFAVRVDQSLFLVSHKKVLRLNTKLMHWDNVGDGVSVTDAGICGGEGAIFVAGGKEGNAVKRFLIEQQKWDELPPLAVKRRAPGVVCLSNVLYVMGGYSTDQSGPTASVESFDLASGKWFSLPPLLVARFRFSCVTLDGKIFAMGGRDNVRSLSTVEIFDAEAKKWYTPDQHLLRARDEFCATIHEGLIYCFGGRGEKSVECFDPDSGGGWEEIGVMGEGRLRTGLSCVNFTPVFDD